MSNLWIEGGSKSGKTERIVQRFCDWSETDFAYQSNPQAASQKVLVLTVDSQQRRELGDRLMIATHGSYPVTAVTPLSFFRDEVRLFWTLLVKTLDLKAQFPLLLRVENEQELANKIWKDRIETGTLQMEGIGRDRLVRRLLDLFLLAAYGGREISEIPAILNAGIETNIPENPEGGENNILEQWQEIGEALQEWRKYCWERGLLTYGIITDLFAHYLLPNPQYQRKLRKDFDILSSIALMKCLRSPATYANSCLKIMRSACLLLILTDQQDWDWVAILNIGDRSNLNAKS